MRMEVFQEVVMTRLGDMMIGEVIVVGGGVRF